MSVSVPPQLQPTAQRSHRRRHRLLGNIPLQLDRHRAPDHPLPIQRVLGPLRRLSSLISFCSYSRLEKETHPRVPVLDPSLVAPELRASHDRLQLSELPKAVPQLGVDQRLLSAADVEDEGALRTANEYASGGGEQATRRTWFLSRSQRLEVSRSLGSE